jgi:hypothetical protein
MLELYDTWHEGANVKACDEFSNDPMNFYWKCKTLFVSSIFLCLVVIHIFFVLHYCLQSSDVHLIMCVYVNKKY